MKKLFFIIGASGSGKTTVVKNLKKEVSNIYSIFSVDDYPKFNETNSVNLPEDIQRISTLNWVKKVSVETLQNVPTILDMQSRSSFIDEACKMYAVTDYAVILFDCSDEERERRLHVRGQPELAHPQMMNWAKFLRNDAKLHGYTIIDNTTYTEEESVGELKKLLF
jgi:adenylate kinase family enzyme